MDQELVAEPRNRELLAYLERQAVPRTVKNASPWDVDEFELHVHPDLTEVLDNLVSETKGAWSVALFGCVGAVREGVLFAFVQGIGLLGLRTPVGGIDIRLGPSAIADLGDDWSAIEPFPMDVSSSMGRQLLLEAFHLASARAS